MTATLSVDALTGTTGAVIEAVDLRTITDDQLEALESALMAHLVLFFPDQALQPADQLAFGRRLGELDQVPFGRQHPDHPELIVLDQAGPKGEGTDAWHSDNTFRSEPPKYTMLQAVSLPPTGGDTCWSNMYEVYASLSAPMRGFLDGLTATHDLTKMLALAIERGHSDADLTTLRSQHPPEHHPVVRTHPVTGRKALFVNGNFTTHIDGLTDVESRRVLDLLLRGVTTPEFQCRYRWAAGTVALWDNRCLQHYAVPDYQSRRIMHRVTIRGDRPV